MTIRRAVFRGIALAGVSALTLAGFTDVAVASHGKSAAHKRCRTYQVAGKKIHLCNGLNGKNGSPGSSGPAGPQGASGPGGPPGANGRGNVFNASLRTNQANTTVYAQNGVRIEASCPKGILELFVIPESTGNFNIVQDTVFDDLAGTTTYLDGLAVGGNTEVDMLAGASGVDDFNGLLTVRLDPGGQLSFIQWWASGGNNHPLGNCLVGGTASY